MLKKGLIYSVLLAGGAAAYYLIKKLELKTSEKDEVTFVRLDENNKQYNNDIDEISKLYPNLNKRFIDKVYSKSDELNTDYPYGTLVEFKHNLSFSSEEKYNELCSILNNLGYEVSGVMNSFVASKKFYVEKGRLLSEIFNMANQVNYLNGMYTGYEIVEQ